MRKIAIIGAGNVGIAAAKALLESPDMELCGFIRRGGETVPDFEKIPVEKNIFDLPEKPDGAIITVPSRFVEPIEEKLLEAGVFTVDCFDIHEKLPEMRKRLNVSAEKGNVSCVVGAGWDPGLDSVIRTLMSAAFPKGKIHTNFGPGMSMGHSAAAKSIDGVLDAVSITSPLGKGKHARKIYVLPEENADKQAVEHAILSDGYFEHDQCSVEFVKDISQFFNTKHGVFIENIFENQKMNFSMEIDNPTLTGNILVSAMRAAFLQKPGAYLIPEIPPCNLLYGNAENLV
ncbi:MAG: diaminopimelate dehydrogenase [Oscillospiraceae bacterium]|nr:diaminopimelate dehydrogenase [Oscillospiraceae bacterium]